MTITIKTNNKSAKSPVFVRVGKVFKRAKTPKGGAGKNVGGGWDLDLFAHTPR